jgi:hypothetical protein
MAELTPSGSPSAHEIVVKDQREAIKNVFLQRVTMFNRHMRTAGELVIGIYDIFIELLLSSIP